MLTDLLSVSSAVWDWNLLKYRWKANRGNRLKFVDKRIGDKIGDMFYKLFCLKWWQNHQNFPTWIHVWKVSIAVKIGCFTGMEKMGRMASLSWDSMITLLVLFFFSLTMRHVINGSLGDELGSDFIWQLCELDSNEAQTDKQAANFRCNFSCLNEVNLGVIQSQNSLLYRAQTADQNISFLQVCWTNDPRHEFICHQPWDQINT